MPSLGLPETYKVSLDFCRAYCMDNKSCLRCRQPFCPFHSACGREVRADTAQEGDDHSGHARSLLIAAEGGSLASGGIRLASSQHSALAFLPLFASVIHCLITPMCRTSNPGLALRVQCDMLCTSHTGRDCRSHVGVQLAEKQHSEDSPSCSLPQSWTEVPMLEDTLVQGVL